MTHQQVLLFKNASVDVVLNSGKIVQWLSDHACKYNWNCKIINNAAFEAKKIILANFLRGELNGEFVSICETVTSIRLVYITI